MVGEEQELYAGRWVARLRGRIVAQGGTPEQARRAAQSRYKENPEITFMPTTFPLTFSPLVDSVRGALPRGISVYLIGGAVRDALLGRPTHDLDFAVERDAIRLARKVADDLGADFYPLDPGRDTGRVLVGNPDGSRTMLDFAVFRGADLEADIRGRDFTLNAIAYDLNDNTLHDPLGGAMDLKEKRLKACSPTAFSDDPVRILRGVRLAAQFGFHILPEARQAMKAAVGRLDTISAERLRDEFFRILGGPQPAACLRALDLLGALGKVLPELPALKGVEQIPPHVHDVWDHTLAVVSHLDGILAALRPEYDPDSASDLLNGLLVMRIGRYRSQIGAALATEFVPDRTLRSLLFLGTLYHDVAKPQSKKADETGQIHFWEHDQRGAEVVADRARRLALSKDEIDRLETLVRNHMRIHFHTDRLAREAKPPTRRAIYRFFRDTGSAGVDLCLLGLADLRATYEQTLPQETWASALDVVRMLLEAWFERREEQVAPPVLLDGNDLMHELSLKPGPLIGKLLEAIREAQAVGSVSDRDQALVYIRDWMKANT
ncbi:MAG TPA: HD domain-containing protein [Anaerolineales bacterium]|nr:HD domain-containing protein [Anaerolineales bacterium]